jgi:hypothetical protein
MPKRSEYGVSILQVKQLRCTTLNITTKIEDNLKGFSTPIEPDFWFGTRGWM